VETKFGGFYTKNKFIKIDNTTKGKIFMIRWRGIHDELFELEILNYQFPEIQEGHDANWIMLGVNAKNELGSWSRQSSCMLAWELEWLHRWMRYVVHGQTDNTLVFLETDLKFQYIAQAKDAYWFAICLRFGLSFYPDYPESKDHTIIVVQVSEIEIQRSINYLKQAMEIFPPRGKQGESVQYLPGPEIYIDKK
jgi:hypothetical protein